MNLFKRMKQPRFEVTFLSLLDHGKSGIIRVLVSGDDAICANLWVSGAKVKYIGWPQGDDEFTTEQAVFSLIFKNNIKDNFKVRINGRVVAQMTPHFLDSLTRLKNCTFINPEIDGFYNEIQTKETYDYKPYDINDTDIKFSILIPLYKTPVIFFRDLIKSILSQTYTNYEVILVNSTPEYEDLTNEINSIKDLRVRVVDLDTNYGIVGNTNRGISYVTGDYVMFVDHDDALSPNFLKSYLDEIHSYIEANGFEPDLVTCDEDRFVNLNGKRFRPLYKHDYCENLHMSLPPYLGHCVAVRKKALDQVELSGLDVEGSQDYDICLKIEELNGRVAHVSRVVYHWREHESSISSGESVKPYIINSMTNALKNALQRRGIDAEISAPRWSYVFNLKYKDKSTKFDFIGFSDFDSNKLNSEITNIKSSYVLLYDNEYFYDVEALDMHELIERVKVCKNAVVAPKLTYKDGTNFMCGLAISEGNVVALNQNFESGVCGGYRGYAECDCSYTAVSPHIFALDRDIFMKLGGFREFSNKWLSVIDYCIRANISGYDVCVTNSLILNVYGEVSWANLKDSRIIASTRDHVPIVDPSVVWGTNSADKYIGLGRLPKEVESIDDRLYNKNVDYRTGYAHLKVEVPREVYPEDLN